MVNPFWSQPCHSLGSCGAPAVLGYMADCCFGDRPETQHHTSHAPGPLYWSLDPVTIASLSHTWRTLGPHLILKILQPPFFLSPTAESSGCPALAMPQNLPLAAQPHACLAWHTPATARNLGMTFRGKCQPRQHSWHRPPACQVERGGVSGETSLVLCAAATHLWVRGRLEEPPRPWHDDPMSANQPQLGQSFGFLFCLVSGPYPIGT